MTRSAALAPTPSPPVSAAPAAREPRAHPARERLLRHLLEEGGDPELLRVLQDAALEEQRRRQRLAAHGRRNAAQAGVPGPPAEARLPRVPLVALAVLGAAALGLGLGIAVLR